MNQLRKTLLLAVVIGATAAVVQQVEASFFRRSYYASWSYYPSYNYYYRPYYYKPYSNYSGYKYHYCIYYPSQRYVYYYNPYSKNYWGRYDIEAEGYSLLAEADRKASLKDIPESAFPKPGAMPAIPESEDGETIPKIAKDDLPSGDTPKGLPGGNDAPK